MTLVPVAAPDDELLAYLYSELNSRLEAVPEDSPEQLLSAWAELPKGLRALASVHDFDVQFAIGGLAWYFAQWPDVRFIKEAIEGLRELGAPVVAVALEKGWNLTVPYLDMLTEVLDTSPDDFSARYEATPLALQLKPLNLRLQGILTPQAQGIYQFLLPYARKYPAHFE